MGMPEPNPGQPRLRQYEQESDGRPSSDVNIPNVPYVVAAEVPGGITTYGNLGRSSTGTSKGSKKGKKSKRGQPAEVPEITINPPVRASYYRYHPNSCPFNRLPLSSSQTNQSLFVDFLKSRFRKANPVPA